MPCQLKNSSSHSNSGSSSSGSMPLVARCLILTTRWRLSTTAGHLVEALFWTLKSLAPLPTNRGARLSNSSPIAMITDADVQPKIDGN